MKPQELGGTDPTQASALLQPASYCFCLRSFDRKSTSGTVDLRVGCRNRGYLWCLSFWVDLWLDFFLQCFGLLRRNFLWFPTERNLEQNRWITNQC